MSYDIKKLSEVEALPEVPEGANMIAEVGGQIKRVPAIESPNSIVPPLPADNPGNKQLVTDSTGETKWIDQYCYEAKGFVTRLEEQTIDFSSAFYLGFAPRGGVNYVVYVDGRVYNLTGVTVEIIPNEIYVNRLIPEDGSFLVDGYYMSFEDEGSHVVKIGEEGTTIKTLDDKFLSNSVVHMDSSCKASGAYSHAEGYSTTASGEKAHAEGNMTAASGSSSHAEGYNTTASGSVSHAEGNVTTAFGAASHAEGNETHADGDYSHAEGYKTHANGDYSHAEGSSTTASGSSSHAEGNGTTASGNYSHVEGNGTTASGNCSHVEGQYNIEDTNNIYAHIVGNGVASYKRSNSHTLDWSGNAWYAGTVEGTAMIVKSSTPNSTKRFKITVDDSGTLTATEVTT